MKRKFKVKSEDKIQQFVKKEGIKVNYCVVEEKDNMLIVYDESFDPKNGVKIHKLIAQIPFVIKDCQKVPSGISKFFMNFSIEKHINMFNGEELFDENIPTFTFFEECVKVCEVFYKDKELHRENGPAYWYDNGDLNINMYAINGEYIGIPTTYELKNELKCSINGIFSEIKNTLGYSKEILSHNLLLPFVKLDTKIVYNDNIPTIDCHLLESEDNWYIHTQVWLEPKRLSIYRKDFLPAIIRNDHKEWYLFGQDITSRVEDFFMMNGYGLKHTFTPETINEFLNYVW